MTFKAEPIPSSGLRPLTAWLDRQMRKIEQAINFPSTSDQNFYGKIRINNADATEYLQLEGSDPVTSLPTISTLVGNLALQPETGIVQIRNPSGETRLQIRDQSNAYFEIGVASAEGLLKVVDAVGMRYSTSGTGVVSFWNDDGVTQQIL